ncbi:hypothetical protein N789_13225 [Arenimonas oryziterrae DSM 21050 = YC6267]|uniref:Uncharacterized protein n=2 Tax=Arenimonas TaxID=490567 RepID=A0A091ATB1_9GAMM|nr:hypothetical protein N789_13225 [Arenimonas oryziterrae DSM 21050 = YC6267]
MPTNPIGWAVAFSAIPIVLTPIIATFADEISQTIVGLSGGLAGGAAFIGGIIVLIALVPTATCEAGTMKGCIAGVVNAVDPGVDGGDAALPWMESHPSVQLVCKSSYWPFLMEAETEQTNPPAGAWCIETGRHSPYIVCYYYSEVLCNASKGALAGAAIGGVAGVLVAIAVVAAIACSSVIGCLFALLLAALIGAAFVFGGMMAGGHAGAAAGTDIEVEDSEDGVNVQVGDYVTLKGKFGYGQQTERIGLFIEETAIHGRSTESAPFSFTDPDSNLTDDDCPVSDVPM